MTDSRFHLFIEKPAVQADNDLAGHMLCLIHTFPAKLTQVVFLLLQGVLGCKSDGNSVESFEKLLCCTLAFALG